MLRKIQEEILRFLFWAFVGGCVVAVFMSLTGCKTTSNPWDTAGWQYGYVPTQQED